MSQQTGMTEARYREWYQQSIDQPSQFWGEQAKRLLAWQQPFHTVLEGSFKVGEAPPSWFVGGKLNASENCLDRHLATHGESTAILWEGDDASLTRRLSYAELHRFVCQFANGLKSLGVVAGDRICIYMPMIPEAIIAMLACARIGAVHSVVFGGFSAEALKSRIVDAECRLVITADESVRGGKHVPMKQHVDAALLDQTRVTNVVVVQRTGVSVAWEPSRDIWYHELMSEADEDCKAAVLDANDPLFILYTSGSTGKPKGILHAIGGYLVYAAMTFQYVFDYQPGEIYWCTADIGWITGHTYGIYAPLMSGATIVMFEGVPHYPTPARWWQIVDKYKVNIFYTAPTAIRALRREGDDWVQQTKRDSLRVLGSVGEPINPEAWHWYDTVVGHGRCPIVDTWWQTETGGIMISPLANVTPMKAGSASWPFFGVVPKIVDDEGNEVPLKTMGNLVITQPWPGMMRAINGDPNRVISLYFQTFPGKYASGDQAYYDADGYFWISGRSDDVIKVSGHRIGTEEVESALILHHAVSEAAVVAVPDDIKGQVIYAFVNLRNGYKESPALKQELIEQVRHQIGPIATPAVIQWANALPKTRSGKILRRLLRKIAANEVADLGDLSTLADASVVEALIKQREDVTK